MTHQTIAARDEIRQVIERINDSWLAKRYDDIGPYVADDVVVAPPGSDLRISGRTAYVDSYRDYDRAATTREFVPGDPVIDVVGGIAVAVCPFFIVYELEGVTYRETGRETLVFSNAANRWRVVWRSVQSEDK